MFCPKCGQQQLTEETKFCSRCGFSLCGVWDLLSNNGTTNQNLTKHESNSLSPRRKGLKQGGQLMIFGLIAVPLLVIVSDIFNMDPTLVVITSILTFWGGILRMLYARLFEAKYPSEDNLEQNAYNAVRKVFGRKPKTLPPQPISVSSYVPPALGNWRNTNDLVQPSVTENTTRFIRKDN